MERKERKYLDKFVRRDFIEQELQFSEVYVSLDQYQSSDLYQLEELSGNPAIKQNQTIWILWLQGFDQAPALVKKCCDSIFKYKPEHFEIVLLTRRNMKEYIQLPAYVLEKYDTGIITATHLSDIIRLELLGTYGGCWIDATVFCSAPIPEYMLSDMFLFKLDSILCDPVIKMSSWWMAADRRNRIIHASRRLLLRYWESKDQLSSYFLLHLIMSKVIDADACCQELFRKIPFFNSKNAQILVENLGLQYQEGAWDMMKDSSFIQKLTCKKRHIRGDIYNFYTALLEGKLG